VNENDLIDQIIADERLRDAAPRLLEALKDMRDAMETFPRSPLPWVINAYKRALSAIAEAEGKS